jgi:hypothetical protein
MKNLESLIENVFSLNEKMNQAKRAYDAERKKLFMELAKAGVKTATVDGYQAIVSSATRREIDVVKLAGFVDQRTLLQIVTATVANTEKMAGSSVAAACTIETPTSENVSVKKL